MSPRSPRHHRPLTPQAHRVGPPASRIPHPASSAPRGFTLVELMVVIVIISILIAMLLPAINAVRAGARVTEVQVEIRSLESGITNFKTEFGIDPPSSIILYEDGTAAGAWSDVPSRTLIRRLWPQFDFTGPGAVRDINGDGDTDDVIELTGAECLVFFLGGVTATDIRGAAGTVIGTVGSIPTEWIPLGFSRNPRNPFERGSGTRTGPFHEFDGGRLFNHFFITGTGAGDHGMPEYRDTLPSQTQPYLYASSYDGKGYDRLDLGGDLPSPYTNVTSMTNVYLQKDDDPAVGDSSEVAWKQTAFQIISPGFDGEYGVGGFYDPDQRFDVSTFPNRRFERDNITNFGSGILEN